MKRTRIAITTETETDGAGRINAKWWWSDREIL